MDKLFTLFGALLVFTLGLLAWRQQLQDKRRFEVAEQVVVYFAKMAAQIRILRRRHGYEGMPEFIDAKIASSPASALGPSLVARREMARREFIYRIPDKKQNAFNELAKDYEAVIRLARLYLTEDIAKALAGLDTFYQSVESAARTLARIYPNPTADQNAPQVPLPDSELYGIEITRDDALASEQRELPIRFDTGKPGDSLDILIDTTSAFLNGACRPYTDQGPYAFLWNFIRTLVPDWAQRLWKTYVTKWRSRAT